jgi:hypothetical protein
MHKHDVAFWTGAYAAGALASGAWRPPRQSRNGHT